MLIVDELCNHNVEISAEDPYEKALAIMAYASGLGYLVERKNEYMTNGPNRVSNVEFDLVENVDDISRIIISVVMKGSQEKKTLELTASTKIRTGIKERGFFSAALAEYYMKKFYHTSAQTSRKKAKELEHKIEAIIEQPKKGSM